MATGRGRAGRGRRHDNAAARVRPLPTFISGRRFQQVRLQLASSAQTHVRAFAASFHLTAPVSCLFFYLLLFSLGSGVILGIL